MGFLVSAIARCLHFRTAPPPEPKEHEDPCSGQVGSGALLNNVKVLYINGIRNSCQDAIVSSKKISELAHSLVYFVHTRLGFLDAFFSTNRIKKAGHKAALRIKELIQDHSAQNTATKTNEISLVIITHSAGGLVLKEAAEQLDEEEKKKITIFTFGSTYLFPKKTGFRRVTNIMGRGDLIPQLGRLRRSGGEIVSVGKGVPGRSWSPITEHAFLSPVYIDAIKRLFEQRAPHSEALSL